MTKKLIFLFFLYFCVISCGTKKIPITDANLKNGAKNENAKPVYTYNKELSTKDRKYFAKKLNVEKEAITNDKLYIFIKSWEETTYLYGGETKNGIDCSALMQHLFKFVYNVNLPRTSVEMSYDNKIKFSRSMENLKEGDLVFFKIDEEKIISHVGIYLQNGMFFQAGSADGCSIVSIKKPYWEKKFVGGGRLRN